MSSIFVKVCGSLPNQSVAGAARLEKMMVNEPNSSRITSAALITLGKRSRSRNRIAGCSSRFSKKAKRIGMTISRAK